jgi:FkbM family methyltransferase
VMREDLIFDVGMHKGEDSEFYLKKGFRVVAVEAHPQLCHFARERLAPYVESGRLTIINAAIAKTAGPVTFFANDRVSVWGTILGSWAERNRRMGANSTPMTINGVTFGTILEKYGIPYYLKIDIEGADLLCLEALTNYAEKPKYISVESTKTSWRDLLEEFKLLRSLGYSKFKVINQTKIAQRKCPFPAREGRYVDYTFEPGSSGLFGDETPGFWLSEYCALIAYAKVFAKYWLVGNEGIFPNLHRRVPVRPTLRRLLQASWYDTHAKR